MARSSLCALTICAFIASTFVVTIAAPSQTRTLYFSQSSSSPSSPSSPFSFSSTLSFISMLSSSLNHHSSSPSSRSSSLHFSSSPSSALSSVLATLSQSPVAKSLRSKLTCDICQGGVTFLQFLASTNTTQQEIVKAANEICVRFNIETRRVCKGITAVFAPEVLAVLQDLVLSPGEVCGLFLGRQCGDPYNPLDNWNVTFPDVPQPKPSPPVPPKPGAPKLRVLHLSDTHFDARYKEGSNAVCGEPLCCRDNDGIPSNKSNGAGKFGDYRNCDTPLWTLENMLQHLAAQNDKFDFIYWTGDLPAHNVWNQTRAAQLDSLTHMVKLILTYFPGKPVFPSLGNHESAPVNSFPPPYITGKNSISWLYDALAESWKSWLPADAVKTVQEGAYFTVSPHAGFRIISLNMNYCNSENWWLLINTTDPAGELSWLIQTLQAAEDAGEKVHILGHIPPGDQGCLKSWSWNYYKIVNRYQNIISGQFFGHTHYDSFQVFYDLDTLTTPVGVAYTAPSVTPFSGLNIGYRLYTVDGHYNGSSYQVLDHDTYILNLTRANMEGKITWEFEYSAKAQYNMTSLYPHDWDKLITEMKSNQKMLETYNRLYFKSVHSGVCDATCRQARLCEARSARSHDPQLCRDLGVKGHREMYGLVGAAGRRKQC